MKENFAVRLPPNIFILGYRQSGSCIYIHPCYPQLLKTALSIVSTRHLPWNSWNWQDILWILFVTASRSSGETVIYQSGFHQQRFLLTPNGVAEGGLHDFRKILCYSSTYYIVDDIEPEFVDVRTILLTCGPRYSKTACTFRFMSAWTKEEILCVVFCVGTRPTGYLGNNARLSDND